MLEALTARGIPMGVFTSKRVDFAERILSMFSLRTHFLFVSGGEDGASKTEHLADLIEQGLVPWHAVMIGNRAVDVVAVRANGLVAAGVLWGHGSEAELRNAGAHQLFAEPHALLQLVETESSH